MVDLRKWSTRVDAGDTGFWELDSSLSVRMVYGLDENGRYSFGYFSEKEPQTQTISKAIQTVTRQRATDGQWTQVFILNDPSLKGPFTSFCDHMAREIASASSVDFARRSVVDTIAKWRRLFSKGFGVLDITSLRGLFAELYVGFELSNRPWSNDKAAGAWTGPYETPHDFDFGELSLEVKSRALGKNVIRVNGEEQLLGEKLGLIVVDVSHTQSPEIGHETLPGLIERIKQSLAPNSIDALDWGLLELGFNIAEEEYHNIYFRATETNSYAVFGDFPRITSKDLPKGITHVSYELQIDSISDYKVEKFVW